MDRLEAGNTPLPLGAVHHLAEPSPPGLAASILQAVSHLIPIDFWVSCSTNVIISVISVDFLAEPKGADVFLNITLLLLTV